MNQYKHLLLTQGGLTLPSDLTRQITEKFLELQTLPETLRSKAISRGLTDTYHLDIACDIRLESLAILE